VKDCYTEITRLTDELVIWKDNWRKEHDERIGQDERANMAERVAASFKNEIVGKIENLRDKVCAIVGPGMGNVSLVNMVIEMIMEVLDKLGITEKESNGENF
jgi:molecular chaperone GrpE (heat shock protein)